MSDPERKSAMARTLERLKSRKRNVQGTPSPGLGSNTPPALATTSPAPQPSAGGSEHEVQGVVQPSQIFPFPAVEAKPVIMYSFSSEDGSTNTVPLVELSQVNMAQSQAPTSASHQIQLQQSVQNQLQNQNQQQPATVFAPKIVSVTSSSTVQCIDLESGTTYSETSDQNEEVPTPQQGNLLKGIVIWMVVAPSVVQSL